MTPPRGKVIALSAGVFGLVILATSLFAFRNRLREEYWLWRLERGDEHERSSAIEKLGEVGAARTILKMHELAFQHSLTQGTTSITVPISTGAPSALRKIEKRLGREGLIPVYIAGVKEHGRSPRLRVILARWMLVWSASSSWLNEPLRIQRDKMFTEHPEFDWRNYPAARAVAIDAIIGGFDSPDESCRHSALCSFTDILGPKATEPILALENARKSSSEDIRKAAAEALRKIRGE